MTKIEYFSQPQSSIKTQAYRTQLIVLGVVLLILCALVTIAAVFTCYSGVMETLFAGVKKYPLPPELVFLQASVYAIVAAALYLLGTGACRTRRWVRPVMCIAACLAILNGVIQLIGHLYPIFNLVRLKHTAATPAYLQQHLIQVAIILPVAGGIPAAILWFFNRASMQNALDDLDPQLRWTDRLSLPGLGWCLGLISIALGILQNGVKGYAPLLSDVVDGTLCMELTLAIAVLLTVAGIFSIRQRFIGWLLGWVTLLLLCGSFGTFYFAGNHAKYYAYQHSGHQLYPGTKVSLGITEDLLPTILYLLAVGYGVWVYRSLMTKRV